MIQGNPIALLLNRGQDSGSPPAVADPAFSLTKVLATAATVLTPLTALLANVLGNVSFSSGDVVALTLGVLGFLAIASSADVAGAWHRQRGCGEGQGDDARRSSSSC